MAAVAGGHGRRRAGPGPGRPQWRRRPGASRGVSARPAVPRTGGRHGDGAAVPRAVAGRRRHRSPPGADVDAVRSRHLPPSRLDLPGVVAGDDLGRPCGRFDVLRRRRWRCGVSVDCAVAKVLFYCLFTTSCLHVAAVGGTSVPSSGATCAVHSSMKSGTSGVSGRRAAVGERLHRVQGSSRCRGVGRATAAGMPRSLAGAVLGHGVGDGWACGTRSTMPGRHTGVFIRPVGWRRRASRRRHSRSGRRDRPTGRAPSVSDGQSARSYVSGSSSTRRDVVDDRVHATDSSPAGLSVRLNRASSWSAATTQASISDSL